MSIKGDLERLARIDAAKDSPRRCHQNHAIVGHNIYQDNVGNKRCRLCRIIRERTTPRRPKLSKRQVHVPLDPALVRELRRAAGIGEPPEGLPGQR